MALGGLMTEQEYNIKREAFRKKALKLLEEGVIFVDLDSVYIDDEVQVGSGTFIGPCVTLEGKTYISENCAIYQNSRIVDSKIGNGTTVQSSTILSSVIGENTSVGPFAYIRPGSKIGSDCKVGDFVEIKNSTLGDGTKSSHLTYIGDADLGKNINLGCGVVFVNYDGTNKHRSTVGDNAFIGCNSNIVSPVTIGDGAYIAAATTVTEDVPKDGLAIGRSKQVIKEGWAKEKGLYRKNK